MPTRNQKTTPFKDGTNSGDHGKDAPKVKVVSDASQSKFSPGHDPLMQSISQGMPELPNRYHFGDIIAEIHPKGVNYNPAGEYGSISGHQAVPPTGMHPHTDPPGKNALGAALNKVGQKSGYPAAKKKSGGGGRRV